MTAYNPIELLRSPVILIYATFRGEILLIYRCMHNFGTVEKTYFAQISAVNVEISERRVEYYSLACHFIPGNSDFAITTVRPEKYPNFEVYA